jgi:predicted permease
MHALARLIVRLCAAIVPRADRSRWREEWLAELDAARLAGGTQAGPMRLARGAPRDAAALRVDAFRMAYRNVASGWRTDFRQTVRTLAHSPRHVITVVLCLGVGITVTVTFFSVINSLFYGEIPGIRERAALVRLFVGHDRASGVQRIGRAGAVQADPFSVADFESFAVDPGPTLSAVAAEGNIRVAVSHGDMTTPALAAFVSGEYFNVLGTEPLHGRVLGPADDRPGAAPQVVIGYHLWRDRFGAAADLVGRRIIVADREFAVAGITPPGFAGLAPVLTVGASPLDSVQIWIALQQTAGWSLAPPSERPWLEVFGRRQPWASASDVRASLSLPASRRSAERPDSRAGTVYLARSHGFTPDDAPIDVLIGVGVILAIPLTVLAVACLNVANLQLARATARARELAVRLAIGASRGQVVRLLTVEAAVLGVLAGVAGWWGTALVLQLAQASFPLALRLDARVLAFTLLLVAAVTVLSGVAPAWVATRRSSTDALRHSARGGGLPHSRLRHALVVLQIATSFVLLAGSNLFVRTAQATRADVPPAIREQVVVAFDLAMLGRGDADASRLRSELEARLLSRPDVSVVSFERDLSAEFSSTASADPADWRYAQVKEVSASFAQVTDARLLAGRWLGPQDDEHAVAVNERLARHLSPDAAVVGRPLLVRRRTDDCAQPPCETQDAAQIVGVIESQRRRVDDAVPDPVIYRRLSATGVMAFDMRVRAVDPVPLAADLRGVVQSIEPRLPWAGFWFGHDLYSGEFDQMRVVALGVGGLGVLALLVAAAGLHAVMAYVVSLRQREFGIRMAIGARPGDLISMVGRLAFRLAAAGLVVGLVVAVPMAFLFRAIIIGVSLQLLDPWVWTPVVLMLAAVAAMAALVPARRASRVDPVTVLRAE